MTNAPPMVDRAPPYGRRSPAGPPGTPRRMVPAWAISVLLHSAGLILLGLALEPATRGSTDEAAREVGIVLVRQQVEQREYFDPADDASDSDADSSDEAADADWSDAAADAVREDSPLDVSEALPSATAVGPGFPEEPGIGRASDATGGAAPTRTVDGAARTSIFGAEGEGYKFVYVFDCSGSMSVPNGRPLAAAKAELLASVESLDRTHQFQIIFFNHEPKPFSPAGQPGRLAFATDDNKQQARRYLERVVADGGTDPEEPLAMAMRMRPDVVFFLTDGDDLDFGMIERITRLNRGGAVIHAVEFGDGPQRRTNRLMLQLASRNQGKYVYVDVNQLR